MAETPEDAALSRRYERGLIAQGLAILNREDDLGARDLGAGIADVRRESEWASHRWPNRAGVPKPTWARVLSGVVRARLSAWNLVWQERIDRNLDPKMEELARAPVSVPGLGDGIHVGEGAPAMAGLIHKHAVSGNLGVGFRRSIVRRVTGETVDLWHARHLGDFLGAVVENRDRAKSARNIIYAHLRANYDLLRDGTKADTDRDDAAEALDGIYADLDSAFASALADVDSSDLPVLLHDAQMVLHERLEAAAGARRCYVLGALGQQGAVQAGAEANQQSALRSIAKICQRGVRAVYRAATVAQAKTAAALYTAHLDGVNVEDRPVWSARSKGGSWDAISESYRASFTFDGEGSARQEVVRVRADNPTAVLGTPEPVAIVSAEALVGGIEFEASVDAAQRWHEMRVLWHGSSAPRPALAARLVARNTAGPSTLQLQV